MKVWKFAAAGVVSLWLIGLALSARPAAQQPQMPAPGPGAKAGTFFKNVTSSTLKDLSVDDFIGAMGVMADSLGVDCSDCHPGAGSDRVDWVIDPARKKMARNMAEMVAVINKTNFGGAQKVSCWTCHHGRITPATSIALDNLYDTPNSELDDLVTPAPGAPSADSVFDKYIQALGGAQRVNSLKSWVATGKSVGYEALGGDAVFTMYANSPNQKSTLITYKDHPERGTSAWVFDGTRAWIKTPRALLAKYETVGFELDGMRFEAQLNFPGSLKTALNNWRVGQDRSIGDKDYTVLQGTGPRGFLATLYFDKSTNLLFRMVRYGLSPIGRVLVQTDYGNYKDVGGIKFPFEWKFLWMDGRWTAQISDIKTNGAVDATKFNEPQ